METEDIDQISAGGVVYRECEDKKIRVALIRDQNTHRWILPKGRIEVGESLEDTSLREVQEETGLQSLKLIKKIDKTNYWFRTNKKERLTKEVHFFLYRDEDGCEDICVEENNFDKGQWFTKDEAIKKIGFPAQRKILYKAFKMIEKHSKK
ncbi:MAG: NUDIX domain-containing protein [Asgard group archaeon]|nr:NUDIX domain-containing protein [Asgard group archaeon]